MSSTLHCCRSVVTFGHMVVATAGLAIAGQTYMGTLHSATENQVVLMVGTELLTFQITKDTAITLNGKPAKATELKAEDATSVESVKSDDGSVQAMFVKATRKVSAPTTGAVFRGSLSPHR